MAKVAINVLVPEDVRDGIKRLAVDGRSQGDIVTEAYRLWVLSDTGDVRQKMFETMRRIEDTLEGLMTARPVAGAILSADLAMTKAVVDAPELRGFPITCTHCGEAGARAPNKHASICYGCRADKHTNQPAECPVCTAGQSI